MKRILFLQIIDYIPGFAVFEQCRGLNAINNEHFMNFSPNDFDLISLRSQVKTMYFDVRYQLVISDSK